MAHNAALMVVTMLYCACRPYHWSFWAVDSIIKMSASSFDELLGWLYTAPWHDIQNPTGYIKAASHRVLHEEF